MEEEGGKRKLSQPQHKELSQEAKEKAGAWGEARVSVAVSETPLS